jgi:hypothetical protein
MTHGDNFLLFHNWIVFLEKLCVVCNPQRGSKYQLLYFLFHEIKQKTSKGKYRHFLCVYSAQK